MDLISDLLAALDSLTQTLAGMLTDSPLTYLLVFGLVALDVLLPILPAEASVLIAAVLAGTGQLSLAWVIVAATLGAFVGDNVAYWIGRTAGRPLVERILRGNAERLQQVGAQFHDRGGSFIIIGRFVPGGRTAVSIGAGVLHYPWVASSRTTLSPRSSGRCRPRSPATSAGSCSPTGPGSASRSGSCSRSSSR